MSNVFDVGVIGVGVAGAFATYKIAKEHKNVKVVIFDIGRKWSKRRRQIEGFLGCLPNSDGKLFSNDIAAVAALVGNRKANSANVQVQKILSNINDFKVIKDRSPNATIEKKLKKIGYDITLNDHIQIYPKDIHLLSKYIAPVIENNKNILYNFDNEVTKIYKQKNMFVVVSEGEEYKCKKLIIAVGRSGWRWVKEVYENFGIIENNDVARFGVRIEMNAQIMKDFNKSCCTLTKGDVVEAGPFSWFGTVIPEDHLDVAISAFRSNENRWKTDKVSFNLIGKRYFPKTGFEQTDRISKLTFILANDRIIKERVSNILNGKSKISIIPEYDWLKETIAELATAVPEIATKSYFHIPTITPMPPSINIGSNLESEVSGMFVVGEAAGIHGILSAAMMGLISADAVLK